MPSTPPKQHTPDEGSAMNEGPAHLPPQDVDASRTPVASRARKRTKTGCLTCRKRRIKCDERRPTCANCIKAKRDCEGYAPRLTFREPLALGQGWGQRGLAPLGAQGVPLQPHLHAAAVRPYPMPQTASATQLQFPPIAPRPTPADFANSYSPGMWTETPSLTQQVVYHVAPAPHLVGPASAPLAGPGDFCHSSVPLMSNETMHAPHASATWPHSASQALEYGSMPAYTSEIDPLLPGAHMEASPDLHRFDGVHSAPPPQEQLDHLAGWQLPPTPHSTASSITMVTPMVSNTTGYDSSTTYAMANDSDFYDVDSDDAVPATVDVSQRQELERLLAKHGDQVIGSGETFVGQPDMLATYVPNFSTSPLMDVTTATIYCHFILRTAPFLSIFERHLVDRNEIFTGKHVPRVVQTTWSSTLPVMALRNQMLLQTMLALASLQISRLHNSPRTSSMRHYAFALQKVARAVSSPTKRTTIPTLAATLLLGHYEATTAEHAKWTSHLAGARQLLLEINFSRITNTIIHQTQDPSAATWQQTYVSGNYGPFPSPRPWVSVPGSIDERTLGQLCGFLAPRVSGDGISTHAPPSDKDLEDFQIYRDLYWFYCKQDVIQSCISGNPLLLSFDRWLHCSPRGPLGQADAVWGTMDHMLLLLARVCSFAHGDIARKSKAQSSNESQSHQAPSYGMIPNLYPTALPTAFKDAPRGSIYYPSTTATESFDSLPAATANAEITWNSIEAALSFFESRLSGPFQPLPSDAMPPVNTPFGPAIHYSTYQIATIWLYFYTARIIHLRAHPSMPPSAPEAAQLSGSRTKQFCTTVARIAFGLEAPANNQKFEPNFGAALSESILGLFFAGVDFIDSAQRGATIDRLRTIGDRAGVESASMVAAKLEEGWVKMAEDGRGPPYSRSVTMPSRQKGLGIIMEHQSESTDEANQGFYDSSDVYASAAVESLPDIMDSHARSHGQSKGTSNLEDPHGDITFGQDF